VSGTTEDPFKFSPRRLMDSKYMMAEDFGHDGVPLKPRVTIKTVMKETTGRKWPVLVFKEGWAKPLKLNATSRRALELMFSEDDYRKWFDKRIDLCIIYGNFPKGRKVAIRIWGSPDITRSHTYEVQRFGSNEMDRYNLVPTGKNLVLGPGVIRFGRDAGHLGKPFSEYSVEQLAEIADVGDATLKSDKVKNATKQQIDDLTHNVKEIREYIAAQSAPPDAPSGEPEVAEDEPPLI
jgi:hypothetical protein